ncbi:DUF3878 family protein [Laedolimicola intestinihominis]|uniref:DUF3878 family protein n=1 Tax=Laedolimicola intestinihominis TaxID=3133166 RepID=A0ABV1FH90_9FIRM
MDTFVMLEELLEQDQFELLPAKEGDTERRLVYLMNDAVESFLVFRGAALTGHYLEDYEGALTWSMSRDAARYVLVVRQGDNAVTLLFENLDLEVHLYNYGEIAHFWVPGYEYLRQLEYRIAILRDKCEYLGPEYCTPEERRLAHLAYFPPLNYCCYPAVPAKYIVPIPDPWNPSEEALNVMEELARECGNKKLGWRLKFYRRHPWPLLAKRIAAMLHRTECEEVVDLLSRRLREAVQDYPRRSFGKATDNAIKRLEQQAEERRQELARQGIRAEVLREEPFTIAQDNLEFHVYLMIWETRGRDRRVRIETIK